MHPIVIRITADQKKKISLKTTLRELETKTTLITLPFADSTKKKVPELAPVPFIKPNMQVSAILILLLF